MLATPLAALLLAFAPAQEPDPMLIHEIAIEEVAAVSFGHFLPTESPDNTMDVFVLMEGGGSVLISGGFYSIDGGDFCVYQSGESEEPTVLSTSWLDMQNNMHTVTTDCDTFPNLLECVRVHREALKIMATVFPASGINIIPLPGDVRIGRGGR